MKKLNYLLIMILALITLAQAETIRIGLPIEIKELDPIDVSYVEEYEVFTSVYDSLLAYVGNRGLIPVLADRWEFNKSKKTITFYLKKGLKFSDGTVLNSKDVEFTYKRLLVLDKAKDLGISKCLQSKVKFTNVNQNHPLIRIIDDESIEIGPTDCGKGLVKQFGDTTYGIVSKNSVGLDLKIKEGAPSSGAFSYKKNINGFSLIPNKNNWRWKNSSKKDLTLDFFKIDQSFSSILKNNIDVFRTSSQNIFDQAVQSGYKAVISVPVMVWFLSGDNDKTKITTPYLNILDLGIKKRQYAAFKNNQLEVSADNFFPKDFGCEPKSIKNIPTSALAKNGIIRLINHRNGESKVFIDDIKKEFMDHGISVLVDDEKTTSKIAPINIYINRQFLNDGVEIAMDYAYRVFKHIPDPNNFISNQIEILEKKSLSKEEKQKMISSLCTDQYRYNHIPLSHRKYAFLYKDEKFNSLFFKGAGNLIYNNLIK